MKPKGFTCNLWFKCQICQEQTRVTWCDSDATRQAMKREIEAGTALCSTCAPIRNRAAVERMDGELLRREMLRRQRAPLPSGMGEVTADAFGGGDTPLFNCAWKAAGVGA